ncbi:hypothetical protein [Microbacterium sp. IEGM 1404]|uniref:hypothetical protein n=1 Tax=Microbacterium sp. IEGM 1404 TaxID=3047084 RepID=UPI0024B854AB|nr:hypothetical protein [Microbacterium sp. IEGM 1404]MDI9889949.1 hypothetical protein [Microbacterium sp. IEGM 1404]
MTNSDTVRAEVYLQVAPEYSRWVRDRASVEAIEGAKVVASTQNRSSSPRAGTVEVKLTVEIPKAAFVPLRPEAVVIVPESMTTPHPVAVEAHDANGGDA